MAETKHFQQNNVNNMHIKSAKYIEKKTVYGIINISIWILSKKEGVGHHELHNQR